MSKQLEVNFAGITFPNPITTASGTFGSGLEYSEFVDLKKLGAVTTKGVANVPWSGNPTPRIVETHGGMLNAIGLQNPGIDLFCRRDIPFLKQYDTKIIVNVCGKSTEDYCEVVERLADEPAVSVGTANFFNPYATVEIAEEIEKYHKENNQELIVVLLTFDTDEKGGDDGFNPNDTYTNWQWHLVKTADKKSWEIINWGY